MSEVTSRFFTLRDEARNPTHIDALRAYEIQAELSALYDIMGAEETENEMLYNQEVAKLVASGKSVAASEAEARAGDRYREWRMSKFVRLGMEKLIKSLNNLAYQKSFDERNQ